MVGSIGEVTNGDLIVAAQGKCRERDPEEERLIRALKEGDEASFNKLVDAYHASMIRVARSYVGSDTAAEEVAQEAWLGVLNGLDGFQGRSSLKTWIFHILVNCARKRGVRCSPFFGQKMSLLKVYPPPGLWERWETLSAFCEEFSKHGGKSGKLVL